MEFYWSYLSGNIYRHDLFPAKIHQIKQKFDSEFIELDAVDAMYGIFFCHALYTHAKREFPDPKIFESVPAIFLHLVQRTHTQFEPAAKRVN